MRTTTDTPPAPTQLSSQSADFCSFAVTRGVQGPKHVISVLAPHRGAIVETEPGAAASVHLLAPAALPSFSSE